MPQFPKKWLVVIVAVALLWPLLRPVFPDVVSDYRLFLVSTMIIAAIALRSAHTEIGYDAISTLAPAYTPPPARIAAPTRKPL